MARTYLKEFIDSSTKKQKDALRYEFCVYLVRALNWETQLSNAAVVKYKDASTIIKQAVAYIELLGRKGIVATTGEFFPNKSVTEARLQRCFRYHTQAVRGQRMIPAILIREQLIQEQQILLL